MLRLAHQIISILKGLTVSIQSAVKSTQPPQTLGTNLCSEALTLQSVEFLSLRAILKIEPNPQEYFQEYLCNSHIA